MKVAVIGATGLVGSKMLEVLAERNFPVTEIIPVASEKSIGKKETLELAVMIDPFNPLKITKQAVNMELLDYYKSWVE
jgi:aspartate-semialdehyde dehydrogenase